MAGACEGGNQNIIDFALSLGGDTTSGFYGACKGKNLGLAQSMIQSGADTESHGMFLACLGVLNQL